ncbi:hypothetical protein Micbo1qcDRAFT_203740 [Microdochium bolleyi]|uniref:F-box domain-containing protein n=1 Tax=Microdochium bolleyi TaxID=196109 RepID=A0A136J361_9PEZI|nr:hypothetical protein Micbo1qcDRAFT_203740 [Microdochium bolleyi]
MLGDLIRFLLRKAATVHALTTLITRSLRFSQQTTTILGRLPPELVLAIFDAVPSATDAVCLALSSKRVYDIAPDFKRLVRQVGVDREIQDLLERLEKDSPGMFYCMKGQRLVKINDPLKDILRTGTDRHPCFGFDLRRSFRREIVPNPTYFAYSYKYNMRWCDARLATNYAVLGPRNGIPASALSTDFEPEYVDDGISRRESWQARLAANHELLVSCTRVFAYDDLATLQILRAYFVSNNVVIFHQESLHQAFFTSADFSTQQHRLSPSTSRLDWITIAAMSEATPLLLERPVTAPRDSHPIYLRACHSPWSLVGQKTLTFIRLVFAGYLTSVLGVALKYKLEQEDVHTTWRIPFQFSTVSFILLWAYHNLTAIWTAMHLLFPQPTGDDGDCGVHRLKNQFINFISPSSEDTCRSRRYAFSMFYTTAHVFAFMNSIVYWGVLVPAGHGGFRIPKMPHNGHDGSGGGDMVVAYDPDKGLFDEDAIKPFAILNLWTVTSLIAFVEISFLNSMRRQSPVAAHTAGIIFASAGYLAWAYFGKLLTGHSGLFFLDPDLMGEQWEAVIAASIAWLTLAPGIFSYMYGIIAMRETMTAAPHSSTH